MAPSSNFLPIIALILTLTATLTKGSPFPAEDIKQERANGGDGQPCAWFDTNVNANLNMAGNLQLSANLDMYRSVCRGECANPNTVAIFGFCKQGLICCNVAGGPVPALSIPGLAIP